MESKPTPTRTSLRTRVPMNDIAAERIINKTSDNQIHPLFHQWPMNPVITPVTSRSNNEGPMIRAALLDNCSNVRTRSKFLINSILSRLKCRSRPGQGQAESRRGRYLPEQAGTLTPSFYANWHVTEFPCYLWCHTLQENFSVLYDNWTIITNKI